MDDTVEKTTTADPGMPSVPSPLSLSLSFFFFFLGWGSGLETDDDGAGFCGGDVAGTVMGLDSAVSSGVVGGIS